LNKIFAKFKGLPLYPGPPNSTPNTKEKEKTEIVIERKKSLTKEKTLMPIRRRSKTFVILL
jgi:hypothetical protein